MMTLFRRILSQRNLTYANIFVASPRCNKIEFFHYFGLLHDLLRRQDLSDNWFERRLKRPSNVRSSPFLENAFQQVHFIVRIPKVTLKRLWKFLVINNFNFLHIC